MRPGHGNVHACTAPLGSRGVQQHPAGPKPEVNPHARLHPQGHARKKDEGASAVEYGLLVAAIAALIVVVVFALGGVIQGVFKSTCDKIGYYGRQGTRMPAA